MLNKIDRADARPGQVLDEVYDLFIDLDATEDQLDFPVFCTDARKGLCRRGIEGELGDLLTAVRGDPRPPCRRRPATPTRRSSCWSPTSTTPTTSAGWRSAGSSTARSHANSTVGLAREAGIVRAKVGVVYTHEGLDRVEVAQAVAGDIVAVAGLDEVSIGDSLVDPEDPRPLKRIAVDEPTMAMVFSANTSPLGGREGQYVTARQIRARLEKEALHNVAIRLEIRANDAFKVLGRGELQLAILIETMRREGYELSVSKPEIVTREIDGRPHEPMEIVQVDCPEEYVGVVTQKLGTRRGAHDRDAQPGSRPGADGVPDSVARPDRLPLRVPHRHPRHRHPQPPVRRLGAVAGTDPRPATGALVSDRAGTTTTYALYHLEPRGTLFVGPGTEVYEGMIVGENARDNDMDVNVTREKKLTNMRAAGADEALRLAPPRDMSLDRALEWIDGDELVEVTPTAIRVRKRVLPANQRPRRANGR